MAAASPAEQGLLRQLLKGYSRDIRPVLEPLDTVTVNMSVARMDLGFVDLDNNELQLRGWLMLRWRDMHLRWQPSEHHNIEVLRVPVEKLWLPDVKLYNGRDLELEPVMAIVTSEGNVTWVPPFKSVVSCELQGFSFPFDEQTCRVTFGSWTRDVKELDLQVSANATCELGTNKHWHIVGVEHERNEKKYDCCSNGFPSIEAKILFFRRSCAFVTRVALPAAFMVFLGLLTMLIPPTRARLRLVIVSLLMAAMFVGTNGLALPIAVNALSMFSASCTLVLGAIFVCNCAHLAMTRCWSRSSSTSQQHDDDKDTKAFFEDPKSNIDARRRNLDVMFAIPLTVVFIFNASFFMHMAIF